MLQNLDSRQHPVHQEVARSANEGVEIGHNGRLNCYLAIHFGF